mgnify:CR=1 FL=1
MPQFTYTARTLTGEDVTGAITAGSKREMLSVLAERSLFPLHVAEKRPSPWKPQRRVKTGVLVANLAQLADLLQNGVPLLEALSILSAQCPHPGLADILADVRDQVADGMPLDEAMGKHLDVFGELAVSMVRAGAEGAFLEDALKRTADFLEQQQDLKSRVSGAMIYPVFLASLGVVITTVLIVVFVPKFAELFARLEQDAGGLPELVAYAAPVETFKERLFTVAAAVTSAAGAVADTGALILRPDSREPRLMSLVPPVHIAVLPAQNIYPTLEEAMQTGRWASDMPTNLLLVSGPSKTADIELTLAFGVHGPKELIVFVLE